MSYEHYTVDPYVRIWNRLADGGEICSGGFDPKNDPDDKRKLLLIILGVIAFVLMLVCLSSCSRLMYVPVERTTTVTELMVDTVVEVSLKEVHDTVTIHTRGRDTLSYLSNGLAYSFASIENGVLGHSLGTVPGATLKDSIKVKHIIIRDSIPYPVTVEVEKKLTLWERMKMEHGGLAMGVAAALALVFGLFLWKDVQKKE